MKSIFFYLMLIPFLWNPVEEEKIVVLHAEKNGSEVKIYAENKGYCPYTVILNVRVRNMHTDGEYPKKIVIPARSKEVLVASLRAKKNKSWKYSFKYSYYKGDYQNTWHNDAYVYNLPFEEGKTFVLSQGYNGKFTHQGKDALDFTMPEGTKICAAREGIVVDVKENSRRGCPHERCRKDGNYISIYHQDGSFGEYYHLKKNGSKVKVGDQVQKGEVIGYSGNTGMTSGPHLHFMVYFETDEDKETVKTQFWTSDNEYGYLEEGVKYEAIHRN